MAKLISFIIPTRRLENLTEFFANVEKTASDPACVEVLIKFDDDQAGVKEFIEAEIAKRPFTIKYIITPRLEGVFSLWIGIEQLFYMTDPESYYIQIMSDEPRFKTLHWDNILRAYRHFFKDDVFRLRLSVMKLANYPSHYECTFRPDSFPIYTRRWLELTEGTGDCWGSDAYHQCVAYHLSLGPGSYFNFYREDGLCRDIPIYEIELDGLEFGVGVSPHEQRERHRRNLKEWSRLTSFPLQERFSYLARRMNCYVWAFEHGYRQFQLKHFPNKKTVAILVNNRIKHEISYSVPRFLVYSQNLMRQSILLPRLYIMRISAILFRLIRKLAPGSQPNDTKKLASRLKLKIKKTLFKLNNSIRSPFYIFTNRLDKILERSAPGISVLSKSPKIPERLRPPTEEQISWLKNELDTQVNKKMDLREKCFDMN